MIAIATWELLSVTSWSSPTPSVGGSPRHRKYSQHNHLSITIPQVPTTYMATSYANSRTVLQEERRSFFTFSYTKYTKRKYCNRQKIRTRDFDESPRFRPPRVRKTQFWIYVCL
ncbi:hypothetical protein AVEN_145713-1 [Araneus ventricosus]|uniref:Uncharacterized protein n=1 Tax=Araneus ventricosus TaxID=182803 RepID=A0A4Y2PHY8_ARAVE|nr:hypothetical protein AVEN_145713-1 [Araneus ventricosus]